MAYNPSALKRLSGRPGQFQVWGYSSTDTAATVNTAGYISNAGLLRMQVGDIVYLSNPATGAVTILAVNAIAAGAADLTDGLPVGTTDSD